MTEPMTGAASKATTEKALIETRALCKEFDKAGKPLVVLEGVDVEVRPQEVLALLGRSGSGKSTLLRCMAGLTPPTSGEVVVDGRPLTGPNDNSAMVFQSFALLPWLTVQQNVELGLEAKGVAAPERAARAKVAITQVGLVGYENSFPRELSGGMRQRVGFARALVVDPEVLLMDEPFSALDVLTAHRLRELIDSLIRSHTLKTSSIVIVTHNIEEAVLLADRIIVLGANPGRVRRQWQINLPRPRHADTPGVADLVTEVHLEMTGEQANAENSTGEA